MSKMASTLIAAVTTVALVGCTAPEAETPAPARTPPTAAGSTPRRSPPVSRSFSVAEPSPSRITATRAAWPAASIFHCRMRRRGRSYYAI